MNLYIWKDVEQLTDNYHNGGGIAISAPTLADARAEARKRGLTEKSDDPRRSAQTLFSEDADLVVRLFDDNETGIFEIFPNAGCC